MLGRLAALREGDRLAGLHFDARAWRRRLAGERRRRWRLGVGEACEAIERAVIGDLEAGLRVDDEDLAFALHAQLLADELELVHQDRDVEALRLALRRRLRRASLGVELIM